MERVVMLPAVMGGHIAGAGIFFLPESVGRRIKGWGFFPVHGKSV
jgi:hypothetical protein